MEGDKGKVRKRGLSSSSPSAQNYRLKRTFLMGKRRGSTTPVPTWKMIASQSQSLQASLFGGNAKDLSVSARKLAALLWEVDGIHSPTLKMENSECEKTANKRIFETSKLSTVSEVTHSSCISIFVFLGFIFIAGVECISICRLV